MNKAVLCNSLLVILNAGMVAHSGNIGSYLAGVFCVVLVALNYEDQ